MEVDTLTKHETAKLTPMMEQWAQCKKAAKGALLLFRMGDFYEAFYEDASILAKELELTLTKRQGIPMSGVPWHTCEGYLDRLVAKGYRVAIAEQVEDSKQAKGLVRREIVRIITPGTSLALVAEKANNFLVSLTRVGSFFGLAALDISTGEFKVIEFEEEKELLNEIERLRPSELVACQSFYNKQKTFFQEIDLSYKTLISFVDEWRFEHDTAARFLREHFQVLHLDGFGLKGMVAAMNAAGALLAYVHDELSLSTEHIRTLKPYFNSESLTIDRTGQRNLEIFESTQKGKSLLDVMDKTETPMGGRLLRHWLRQPLLSIQEIEKRHDAVELLTFSPETLSRLRTTLSSIKDLERLIMKVSSKVATPRELLALAQSLEPVEIVKDIIMTLHASLIQECYRQISDMRALREEIQRALVEEPPIRATEGKIFRSGYNVSLDTLRNIANSGKDWMARYQAAIREETGIKSLRVSYNKIFGYYIEVSKGQAKSMPDTFQRRQTLVNAERFTTAELDAYQEKVLTAEEQILSLENQLFEELTQKTASFIQNILAAANALATIDVLCTFAEIARNQHYCRPVMHNQYDLQIVEGRHPVVEAVLQKEQFIPNHTSLNENERLMIITGPNMAGKSTYIRQVALIVILAQIGSFVPATRAHIGTVDKIFTRIGASDDLSRGQSTFMVEMSETASILNNVSSRSLVILDEIGRGTSTFDGLSIAWAVAEYLLLTEGKQAKTLFATHYGELTALESSVRGAANYHAEVQEWKNEIVFLHKITKGIAQRSYGIQVARLAGLPLHVITRALEILDKLEQGNPRRRLKKESKETQLLLF